MKLKMYLRLNQLLILVFSFKIKNVRYTNKNKKLKDLAD